MSRQNVVPESHGILSEAPGRNWSRTVAYGAERLLAPRSLEELRAVVGRSSRIRALGTRHSFSTIADTEGDLVTLAHMPPEIEVDSAHGIVSVSGGTRYGDLAEGLAPHGLALSSFASLPHISLAGAVATATHGSGVRTPCLSADVRALTLVTAEGDLLEITPLSHPDVFAGSVVALGALGIVSRLTLAVEPDYRVRQVVYVDLPAESLAPEPLEEILAGASSVSIFTRWTEPGADQVWVKQRVRAQEAGLPARGAEVLPTDAETPFPETWHGARRAHRPMHPVPGMPAENCTEQEGRPLPPHEALPHFRLGFTPSSGEEIQSEYLIARRDAAAAIAAIRRIGPQIAPILHVSELRTIAADELWLSMATGRESVSLHFTWKEDPAGIARALPLIEGALAPFAPRPHWGKVHALAPEAVRACYPRAEDFAHLVAELDPHGVFTNADLRALGLAATG